MPHPHRTAPLSLTGEEVDEYSQETRRQRTHRSGGAASGNAQHRTSRATALIHHATHWLWLPQCQWWPPAATARSNPREETKLRPLPLPPACPFPRNRSIKPLFKPSLPCQTATCHATRVRVRGCPLLCLSSCEREPTAESVPSRPRKTARPLPTATVLLHHTHTHTRLRLLSSSSPFLPPPLQIASPVRPSLSPAHSLHSCTCHRIDQQLVRTSDLG